MEQKVDELSKLIKEGEINEYTVKTFTSLCGKVIEHYGVSGGGNHLKYLNLMKEILHMKEVTKLTADEQKEIEEAIRYSPN